MTLEEATEALRAIPALAKAVEKLTDEVRSLKEQNEPVRQRNPSKPIVKNLDEKYLSRQELAAQVGCHPKTIQRAEASGLLKPIRFNSRMIRYKASEVARWVAEAS